jgi:hypothetical protein
MDMLGPAMNLNVQPYHCDHTTRNSVTAFATSEAHLLPLWLSQDEVEAIIQLCGASTVYVGDVEQTLFPKLGDLYRAFQR